MGWVYLEIEKAEETPAKSGRLDSNQRPPRPERGALPGCATSRTAGKDSMFRSNYHDWIPVKTTRLIKLSLFADAHLIHAAVGLHGFRTHQLQDFAVIGHKSVHFYFHIGQLGIDSCT